MRSVWIFYLILTLIARLAHALVLSRSRFLETTFSAASLLGTKDAPTVPLVFLPIAGCLAVKIVLQDAYRYYAVADTGSPFLTAPIEAADLSRRTQYSITNEQYGESVGGMEWRKSRVTLNTMQKNMVFGLVPSNIVQDTGGLFCGLMQQDDARPTVLQQLGYNSFVLDYANRLLHLSKRDLLQDNSYSLRMYDLSPYGPNLHHYSVECQSVVLQTGDGPILISKLQRPIVVVIDSGLTGCILSDSWVEELPVAVHDIKGASLRLDSVTLTSKPEYWTLSCFRLPWFTSEDNHPHIIAAGATFLSGTRLTVDAKTRRLQLETFQAT